MSSTSKPQVMIVSPALAEANNGNWHTASRWARMLRADCRTGIQAAWQGEACELLIALHARRSAASIAAFAQAQPQRPLVVVLTGTDLYRDIETDEAAQVSLQLATHLVVLQEQGPLQLPPAWRAKCHVIYQSAPRLKPLPPPERVMRVVQVGHLRSEKDPATYLRAAARLCGRSDIHFTLVGEALDPELGRAAQHLQAEHPHFQWLGGLPRAAARQHIRRAQLLVCSSRMEGGAQVILEAAQSGTAVLASRIPGNLGMLGADHQGYFDLGDDLGLAQALAQARDHGDRLATLRRQTLARAPLFEPEAERSALRHLIHTALEPHP